MANVVVTQLILRKVENLQFKSNTKNIVLTRNIIKKYILSPPHNKSLEMCIIAVFKSQLSFSNVSAHLSFKAKPG